MSKRSHVFALSVLLAVTLPAWAEYVSIEGNLVDASNDTSFNPTTGRLLIEQDTDLITLNDPTALSGTITDGHLRIETFLHGVNGSTAVFWGGSFSLIFDYNSSPYEISGPITAIEGTIHVYGSNYSTIDGAGLWNAVTKDLPGSGNWPDGGGKSSIDTLTLCFNQDMNLYDWTDPLYGETIWSILPNDSAVPEPASLALLALGVVGLIRRRNG